MLRIRAAALLALMVVLLGLEAGGAGARGGRAGATPTATLLAEIDADPAGIFWG